MPSHGGLAAATSLILTRWCKGEGVSSFLPFTPVRDDFGLTGPERT